MHYRNILTDMYKNKSKEDIQLYRGISKLTPDKVRQMFDTPHLGIISTTKMKDYTFFTDPYLGCCFLIIDVPKGTPMLDITEHSKYKDEEEIILPPGILTYKGEYIQKLDNYVTDTYMKVYTCEYRPLTRVKVSNVQHCLSSILHIDTKGISTKQMVQIIKDQF
jgi:hypothetical protein